MSADMTANGAGTAAAVSGANERRLAWPGDPESVTAADIDFEALAHVLANTCRWGGRTRRYHALAAHALIASEEIEALDGLGDEDRRVLALHALLMDAPAAWLGPDAGASQGTVSGRAADRAGRLAAGIERAVREAAGLDPVLADEHAELLRFIARMTLAAERRDLFGGDGAPADAGAAFPPLKRRIRPLGPGRAAKLWLARFRILARPPDGASEGAGGNPASAMNDGQTGHGKANEGTGDGETDEGENNDVADVSAKEGLATGTRTGAPERTPGRKNERRAA